MTLSRVFIGGNSVGIVDLEDIFVRVREAKLPDAERVKDLILDKVRIKNYIPARMVDGNMVFSATVPSEKDIEDLLLKAIDKAKVGAQA